MVAIPSLMREGTTRTRLMQEVTVDHKEVYISTMLGTLNAVMKILGVTKTGLIKGEAGVSMEEEGEAEADIDDNFTLYIDVPGSYYLGLRAGFCELC